MQLASDKCSYSWPLLTEGKNNTMKTENNFTRAKNLFLKK